MIIPATKLSPSPNMGYLLFQLFHRDIASAV
jgi:hypothetical protein